MKVDPVMCKRADGALAGEPLALPVGSNIFFNFLIL
jgi:hypothetical protein